YYKELEASCDKEFRRFPLDAHVYAYPGSKLVVNAEGLGQHFLYESEEILEEAKNNPTTEEQVQKQFAKLNETIFTLNDLHFEECNAFIPVKMLNNARRAVVQGLYDAKIDSKARATKEAAAKEKIAFEPAAPYLTATVNTKEQYDACVKAGIKTVYYDNIVRRNQIEYTEREGELLVGGYGGIYYYRDKNPFVTDYSLNVVNSTSVYELHRQGAKRVTLSYELNKQQIKDLLDAYYAKNDGYPALEMVVYGRAPLMFTKYCPLKKMGQCGVCREKTYEIKDEYGSFPVIPHEDHTVTILNGKILNLLDEMPTIEGVEAFRLNFTIESPEEVTKIVKEAQKKLNGTSNKSLFNKDTDTRGHFNKEII
ncbi:MAG: DUF3656 domain-containing protein, partial [Firmicutes bacterium]|nr:DUF3656 domain-containing protein [Bacillota bacterium]